MTNNLKYSAHLFFLIPSSNSLRFFLWNSANSSGSVIFVFGGGAINSSSRSFASLKSCSAVIWMGAAAYKYKTLKTNWRGALWNSTTIKNFNFQRSHGPTPPYTFCRSGADLLLRLHKLILVWRWSGIGENFYWIWVSFTWRLEGGRHPKNFRARWLL